MITNMKASRKLNRRKKTTEDIKAWLLMLPAVFIIYTLIWRPTVLGGAYSFFNMQGYTVGNFCGLKNYIQVISHTQFVPMLINTLWYVFWSFVIGFIPPIVIAVMLQEIVHFKSGFRALIYLPALIPGISAMLIWYFIYYPDQTGLLNMFLAKFNIAPYAWLNDSRFTIIGIIIYMTWKGFPGTMLLYYAALQGVSAELYEVALIDGASAWKRFWNVTRPALAGLIILNMVQQIIGIFQTMDVPLAMTGGGPNGASMTLSLQLYNYGFRSGGRGTGQAMALGVIIFLILIVFTLVYFWLNKRVEKSYY